MSKRFIYIHTTCLEGWEEVYDDVVSCIPEQERCNIISVVLGDPKNHPVINPVRLGMLGVEYDEVATLQVMWNHARYLKEEAHFYYMHLKGLTRRGEERNYCNSWRRFMLHFMFKDMALNQKLLQRYDCLGSMLLYLPLHYQGNFFVTKTSHIKKLPYIEYWNGHRYHETWVTCIGGKYANYIGNYNLMNLYAAEIKPENYRISPNYAEQVRLPHGTLIIPFTGRQCVIDELQL